ncbi:ABC transporter permease [Antrihabitans cavernicola]|uniref:FtsX-like permease family protein n=1 Tax=Antrihabitans cavernicola TaxID=2495913 RepID=A0A5A7S703_9NOCA|nr:FtsX-like permease family protein [Spelaeibacter cavernicola]KAA0019454.1 FtsX-like permease family protein [Spelaeibacter cavernicola]
MHTESTRKETHMFIGIREILYAKGRFALICSVIGLMTFMVVMLSALTNGLQAQSISAIERLPGSTLVMQETAAGQQPSLAQSTLDQDAISTVHADDPSAAELGITNARLSFGERSSVAALFGADDPLMPRPDSGRLPSGGGVMLGADQANELGAHVGDMVTVGSQALRVESISDTGYYAHSPVVFTTVDTWRQIAHSTGVTALVTDKAVTDKAVSAPGTTALPMSKSVDAIPGYTSEHGSLLAMQAMLLAISALVVGAFFAVWTIQRLPELAVVRAMGADRGFLLRDGLGQAVLVLIVGESIGAAAGLALAWLVSGVVPVAVTVAGIALPIVAMTVLGTVGAVLAVRRVTVVDPLVALAR